jgi:hypothetical protein
MALVHGSEDQLFRWLQNFLGAAYTVRASIKDVGIDHGGLEIMLAARRGARLFKSGWDPTARVPSYPQDPSGVTPAELQIGTRNRKASISRSRLP